MRNSKVQDRDCRLLPVFCVCCFILMKLFSKGACPETSETACHQPTSLNTWINPSENLPLIPCLHLTEVQNEDSTHLARRNRAGCFRTSVWISWGEYNFNDLLDAMGSFTPVSEWVGGSIQISPTIQSSIVYPPLLPIPYTELCELLRSGIPFSEPIWRSWQQGSSSPGWQWWRWGKVSFNPIIQNSLMGCPRPCESKEFHIQQVTIMQPPS